MEGKHPIENLMVTAMNSIKQMIDVNTIIGEPIGALNNTVIIPISKVGFGFAAGGSEFCDETINSYNKREKEEQINYRLPFGGGSGAGVSISPVAFLIIQDDKIRLLETNHTNVLNKLIEYIPDAIDKIENLFKPKSSEDDDFYDEDDEFEDDDFDEDDFDNEDFNDNDLDDGNYDDDFSDVEFDDESDVDKTIDNLEDYIFDEEESEKKKVEKGKKVREKHKKEINQIIDDSKSKVKKFEEQIKEVKKDTNN